MASTNREFLGEIADLHDRLVHEMLDNIPTSSERLYHYTSLDTACEIIKSGNIRFTNAMYLNDPAEITGGLKIAEKVILGLLKNLHPLKKYRECDFISILLFKMVVSFTLPQTRKVVAEKLIKKLMPFTQAHTVALLHSIFQFELSFLYVACLSTKSDDLRQWLPYAQNGTGAAIGFRPFDGKHYITDDPAIWIIRVNYKSEAEKESYLERFLLESLDSLSKAPKGAKSDGTYLRIMSHLLLIDEPEMCLHPDAIRDFEAAYFGEEADGEKPYNALCTLKDNPKALAHVKLLLDALIDTTKAVPTNALAWESIEQLSAEVLKALPTAVPYVESGAA